MTVQHRIKRHIVYLPVSLSYRTVNTAFLYLLYAANVDLDTGVCGTSY